MQSAAFSEAPDIFTGLSYADYIAPLPSDEQLAGWLQRREPTVLFVHYWSVHPPYGAADGLAFGEVGQLLAAGRIGEVQTRYRTAIEQLFERHIARLVAAFGPEHVGRFHHQRPRPELASRRTLSRPDPVQRRAASAFVPTDSPRRNPPDAPSSRWWISSRLFYRCCSWITPTTALPATSAPLPHPSTTSPRSTPAQPRNKAANGPSSMPAPNSPATNQPSARPWSRPLASGRSQCWTRAHTIKRTQHSERLLIMYKGNWPQPRTAHCWSSGCDSWAI